jgi:hypothetical protein
MDQKKKKKKKKNSYHLFGQEITTPRYHQRLELLSNCMRSSLHIALEALGNDIISRENYTLPLSTITHFSLHPLNFKK